MFQIFPRNTIFFEFFQKQVELIVQAADALRQVELSENNPVDMRLFHDLEHEGDQLTRQSLRTLVKSFITPLDREDLHLLTSSLDDVLDFIDELATSLELFEIHELTEDFQKLAELGYQGAQLLQQAFAVLPNSKDYSRLPALARSISEVESAADDVYHHAIATLFKTHTDPIYMMKWRELYDRSEAVLDAMHRIGHTLEMISLKHG